jgi:hypothetical protein
MVVLVRDSGLRQFTSLGGQIMGQELQRGVRVDAPGAEVIVATDRPKVLGGS